LPRFCSVFAISTRIRRSCIFPAPRRVFFAKQFAERGLAASGIKIIGPGDLTDDDVLNTMGDQMLGIVTSHDYSQRMIYSSEQKVRGGVQKGERFSSGLLCLSGATTGCTLL